MTAEPTFSIITPAFNPGPYLERAVRSALAQTFGDFEMIVVDDGSTDGSVERLGELADPRLRVLVKHHEGAPAACNAGLARARGRYVAFLDHDDLWAADKLASHLRAFTAHPDVALSFTWSAFVGPDDVRLGLPVRRWSGRLSFEQLLVDNVIGCTSSVAIRRRALDRVGTFDRGLPLMHDLDLYLRLLLDPRASALVIPRVLAFYRRHPGQMSHDWRALRADWQRLLGNARRAAPEATARLERAASVNMVRYFAYVAYEGGDFRAACALLRAALQTSPRFFLTDGRNWKLAAACTAARVLPAPLHRQLAALAGIRGSRG